MTKKTKILISLGVLLAVALIVGLTTLAATAYGTKSDPLVAVSYLNDTVTPNIENRLKSKLDAAASQLKADLDKKLSQFKADISSGGGSASAYDGKTFSVVSLSSGQTVTCGVGTEIMLRIGSVSSAGPDYPRLIDETNGTELGNAGTALTKNHMYMVTIKNNGITATSASKVLIRGDYTVS